MANSFGFFLDDRDYAHFLISDLDIESQLIAISELTSRNAQAATAAAQQIKELEDWAKSTTGAANQRAIDHWVDELHASVYSDAAQSMSAVGMYAPLLESVFSQMYSTLKAMYRGSQTPDPTHVRWQRHAIAEDPTWDPWRYNHYFGKSGNRIDLVQGGRQLADAVGFGKYLDNYDWLFFDAVITYRNHMLHMGFEWPVSSRVKFQKNIEENKWSPYFDHSSSGGRPWIYYLSQRSLTGLRPFVDALLGKIGRFAQTLSPDLLAAKL